MSRCIPRAMLLAAVALIFAMGCKSSGDMDINETTFDGTDYTLVFYDGFSGTSLDETKWTRCPEWQRQDLGGYWNDGCSYVQDGNLVIECRKEGEELLSGAVRTKDKFEQMGGMYKIKFKAEKSSGLWYAFWLMCDEEASVGNGAVDGAEIDIIEIIANDPWAEPGKKQYINSAVHWDGYTENHKSNASRWFVTDKFFDKYHEAVFIWHDSGYTLYLDNELIWEADGNDYGGTSEVATYMKITAEFGTWGGDVQEALLPACLYVDEVAVYTAQR